MIIMEQAQLFIQWPLLAGIVGAMIHVFSGPDHLAAVMPFAVEHRKSSWKIGVSWGIGHLTGMMLIGVLIMLFKEFIPFKIISSYSESFVGFVLIGIGIWAVYRIRYAKSSHEHPHFHADTDEFHVHAHTHNVSKNGHSHIHNQTIRKGVVGSFVVGVIHGFAGIAHFVLFLPMLGFDSTTQSVLYIMGFGMGTVFAMLVFAVVVGGLASKSNSSGFKNMFIYLRYTAASLALLVGVYWIFVN